MIPVNKQPLPPTQLVTSPPVQGFILKTKI